MYILLKLERGSYGGEVTTIRGVVAVVPDGAASKVVVLDGADA
jgi:hypothetical protein